MRLLTVVLVLNNWLPLMAFVLVAFKAPTATLFNTVAVLPGLSVTWALVPALLYLTATAAVLTRLVLRLDRALPTLVLLLVPVTAPVVLRIVVVKLGRVISPATPLT